jgi:hypothetical protein
VKGCIHLVLLSLVREGMYGIDLDKFIISRTIFESTVLIWVGISTFNIELLSIRNSIVVFMGGMVVVSRADIFSFLQL